MSMGIATLIFALLIGRVQITPEVYPNLLSSIHLCFIIFTTICLVGIYAPGRGEMDEVIRRKKVKSTIDHKFYSYPYLKQNKTD